MRTHSSREMPRVAECDHATRSNQDRYTALLTWSYASISDATTSKVTTCGLGKSQSAAGMLTCHGSRTNIVTKLNTAPIDRVDQSIGFGLGIAHSRSKSDGA